jgi:hypothetical protein
MTDEEKKTVVQEVLNQIKTDSQSVDELETVTSLDSVNSLPAMQGEKVVRVPVSLLAKPAEEAAKTANTAACHGGRIIESGRDSSTAGQRCCRCGFQCGTHGQQFGHACR